MEKRNIAIVAGGYSSECVVSIKSAQGIYSFMDKDRYNVHIVMISKNEWSVETGPGMTAEIDKNDFSFTTGGRKHKFDFAYITIHGTPGENGLLQGYFDMIGMPYSNCGVLASSLTFNKYICNHYLQSFGVRISPSIMLRKGDTIDCADIIKNLGLPCFIKPNAGGSSFATTKVKEESQMMPAIEAALKEGEGEVIIEAFMEGTEITCGCYKTKNKITVLPITEVVSKNDFFDFEAKYTASKVEEITPARISDTLTEQIQKQTSYIYTLLGCKGITRTDYIIVGGVPHLLEINTTPGMTTTSFIPQQVKACGMNMQDVLTEIIENELL